jgi:hypothetical protein
MKQLLANGLTVVNETLGLYTPHPKTSSCRGVKDYVYRTSMDDAAAVCVTPIKAVCNVAEVMFICIWSELNCRLHVIRATKGSLVAVDYSTLKPFEMRNNLQKNASFYLFWLPCNKFLKYGS